MRRQIWVIGDETKLLEKLRSTQGDEVQLVFLQSKLLEALNAFSSWLKLDLPVSIASAKTDPDGAKTLGNMRLLPRSREFFISDDQIQLTHLEYQLIEYFFRFPNVLVCREALMRELWQETCVGPKTLDTHLANLRRKMKGADTQIFTIRRSGYILRSGVSPDTHRESLAIEHAFDAQDESAPHEKSQ